MSPDACDRPALAAVSWPTEQPPHLTSMAHAFVFGISSLYHEKAVALLHARNADVSHLRDLLAGRR